MVPLLELMIPPEGAILHLEIIFFAFPASVFKAGDTFSGTVHFDTCSELPDHPGAIVIKESQGNVVRATFVSKVQDKVRTFEIQGFIHTSTRQLILVPEGHDSKSLSLVCDFGNDENSARCQLLRDNLSERCGSFDLKRDYTGEKMTQSLLSLYLAMHFVCCLPHSEHTERRRHILWHCQLPGLL